MYNLKLNKKITDQTILPCNDYLLNLKITRNKRLLIISITFGALLLYNT